MPISPTIPLCPRTPFTRRADRSALAVLLGGLLLALAGCQGANYDRTNADWAQSGMPPPPKTTTTDREWVETEVPPPPSFELKHVITIDMPPYMSLTYGVDPGTIAITGDGIVRYVALASNRSGGALNAFYEGIRCSSEEMKTYARWTGAKWEVIVKPEWKRFSDMKSSYARQLAAQGLCRDHAPRVSVADIVRELHRPEVLMH
jgi:hypothetical protein